jgi:hypothetical protein
MKTRQNEAVMKRSRWIIGAIVMQLLYALMMLALPIYLLILTHTTGVRNGPDAADDISGLKIAAAVLAGPALLSLVGWFALWRGKLWGWWLTFIMDLGLVGVFVYSLADDGWHNLDLEMVGITALSFLPVTFLLLPQVRKCFWRL